MKIGILTFHRAHNYGAVLQCYALQETLKNMGHEAWVIDYRQSFIEEIYKPLRMKYWIRQFLKMKKTAFKYPFLLHKRVKRQKNYISFQKKYLHCTYPCDRNNIPIDFDVYIIGSDQLWNSKLTGGIDNIYWGNFPVGNKSKIITYAISTVVNDLSTISLPFIVNSISRFTHLSVREKSIADYMQQHLKIPVSLEVVLDPTLISEEEIWEPLINDSFKDKKYILIYQARIYNKRPSLLKEKALLLAQELGCDIIDLSDGSYPPEDFVSLFKYASYIVTTSFHAVAFSLIFRKPFYAIKLNDGHDGRYVDLLNSIGCEDRLVEPDFIPEYVIPDYSLVENSMRLLKLKSVEYLHNI